MYLTLVTEDLINGVIYRHDIKYITSLGTLSHIGFSCFDDTVQHWKFRSYIVSGFVVSKLTNVEATQGLLEFIWTKEYSGRSSNPGLALAILVL